MPPRRSLDSSENVDEIALRLNQLRSTSSRKWGTMTPHEMLCHLGDSFEAVLGERTASSKETWLSRTVVKWVALHTSTRDEWLVWGYRHVDHHLRQFGV